MIGRRTYEDGYREADKAKPGAQGCSDGGIKRKMQGVKEISEKEMMEIKEKSKKEMMEMKDTSKKEMMKMKEMSKKEMMVMKEISKKEMVEMKETSKKEMIEMKEICKKEMMKMKETSKKEMVEVTEMNRSLKTMVEPGFRNEGSEKNKFSFELATLKGQLWREQCCKCKGGLRTRHSCSTAPSWRKLERSWATEKKSKSSDGSKIGRRKS